MPDKIAEEQKATKIKTRATLSWPRAVIQSCIDADVDFYPRLNVNRLGILATTKNLVRTGLQSHIMPAIIRNWAANWSAVEPSKLAVESVKSEDILSRMADAMDEWDGPLVDADVSSNEAAKNVLEQLASRKRFTEAEMSRIRTKARASLRA